MTCYLGHSFGGQIKLCWLAARWDCPSVKESVNDSFIILYFIHEVDWFVQLAPFMDYQLVFSLFLTACVVKHAELLEACNPHRLNRT